MSRNSAKSSSHTSRATPSGLNSKLIKALKKSPPLKQFLKVNSIAPGNALTAWHIAIYNISPYIWWVVTCVVCMVISISLPIFGKWVVCGVWYVMFGVWFVVCDVWCVVCGVWRVAWKMPKNHFSGHFGWFWAFLEDDRYWLTER